MLTAAPGVVASKHSREFERWPRVPGTKRPLSEFFGGFVVAAIPVASTGSCPTLLIEAEQSIEFRLAAFR